VVVVVLVEVFNVGSSLATRTTLKDSELIISEST